MSVQPLDLARLKVFPLAERQSLTRADDILIDPDSPPGPCPEGLAVAHRGVRGQDQGRPPARGGGHADLRRAPAPQRRREDPRTHDGGGLADPPRHQRRGDDPRLGIRLVRRVDRERREERRRRHVRHLARDGHEHPPRPDGRGARRPRLRPVAGPADRRGRRDAPDGGGAGRRDRRRAPAPAHGRAGRPPARHGRAGLARRADRRRASLEARLDPRAGVPARRPA